MHTIIHRHRCTYLYTSHRSAVKWYDSACWWGMYNYKYPSRHFLPKNDLYIYIYIYKTTTVF